MPGGTIEFWEEPYETLQREFLEETGIADIEGTLKIAKSYTIIYPYKEDQLEEMHHIRIIYNVRSLHKNYELDG
ncbi:NUDIX domain-containing protein [Paenibacillus wynnii]|uniref:NUDIX domain-containing protein n=1 Tax=Paenibacillus wynnii TaxID=268407 RepID=UPI0027930D62|nr:NUDIX domain-containing protein [Paenibacillus wynnii]MDQ0195575.1 8-oxo-dGTP pyrophosphatase MutT (NUDIX family) [Paenibacillus wynnii]